ncbi:response regulator transcription factor [Amycolatopsis thermophila]|uniref:DNA-binding NarL/FixJ family response regulator n=1 Tax=Amycolatopsis thermophila TaxID=206084 RepID=A0ABU0EP27_9PSEU|nr:LuxR C-terminal-related transcriptional regulator [Amycolatopsis thermophila]MDQ0376552.1 DNA-binding NarL/FixJ family response regulator [Amycolatopsis thermophila]
MTSMELNERDVFAAILPAELREDFAFWLRTRAHSMGEMPSDSNVKTYLARPTITAVRDESLTPRELQVLRGIADGKTDRTIGRELYLSADTVKATAARIYRKLGVANRTEAAVAAVRRRLIP